MGPTANTHCLEGVNTSEKKEMMKSSMSALSGIDATMPYMAAEPFLASWLETRKTHCNE